MAKRIKAGEIQPPFIPVLDHLGNVRGKVIRASTAANASRFGIGLGATLSRKGGKLAWRGKKPSKAS